MKKETPLPAARFRDFSPHPRDIGPRRRFGEPQIFLSWGGEVYGPVTADEILAGKHSASFDANALYWFEGREEWRPIAEFSEATVVTSVKSDSETTVNQNAPAEQAEGKSKRRRGKHSRRHHTVSLRDPSTRRGSHNIGIIFAFALLAVALMTGIILLLHALMRG